MTIYLILQQIKQNKINETKDNEITKNLKEF